MPFQWRSRPGATAAAIGPVADFIDGILDEDRKAPRKQRHTAHRIWVRIGKEYPEFSVSESSVRRYVRERKAELGLRSRETFVPQSYGWGEEGQADWYEAEADLGDERVKLQVFVVRSMASGAAFHRAYYRATQQAFLEAQQLAFHYLGGVFRRLRYDNLTSAVKRILRGYRREETTRFVAFRSHWRSSRSSALPGKPTRRAEWRTRWAPSGVTTGCRCPRPKDLAELNAMLTKPAERTRRGGLPVGTRRSGRRC